MGWVADGGEAGKGGELCISTSRFQLRFSFASFQFVAPTPSDFLPLISLLLSLSLIFDRFESRATDDRHTDFHGKRQSSLVGVAAHA